MRTSTIAAVLAVVGTALAANLAPRKTTASGPFNTALPPRADNDVVVPEYLQCASDTECAIRNVGNCCGYYPRCANVTAVLPPPCPDGGVGVCGFPELDACRCGSKGGCMGLQNGSIVDGAEYV